jgi:hypothetical protein
MRQFYVRESEPVPCKIVYYFPDLKETQWRLMSEIQALLQRALEGQRDRSLCNGVSRVIAYDFRCGNT